MNSGGRTAIPIATRCIRKAAEERLRLRVPHRPHEVALRRLVVSRGQLEKCSEQRPDLLEGKSEMNLTEKNQNFTIIFGSQPHTRM